MRSRLFPGGVLLAVLLVFGLAQGSPQPPLESSPAYLSPRPIYLPLAGVPGSPERSLRVLVDDFQTQPLPGEPVASFNRLDGNHGVLNAAGLSWVAGELTATIAPGQSWGGVWMSLSHPAHEGLALDFAALLPPQIRPAYQSRVTGVTVRVARATPGALLRLELKDGAALRWQDELTLDGGPQLISLDLPALGKVGQLVWVLDRAAPGDFVALDEVALTAATSLTDTATAAFVWSYGMLLDNWNPATGLARDKASEASGQFDAIQATGSLAAATALAAQLGVVERANAIQIVSRIGQTLLVETPRFHGLWPHFVTVAPTGAITIAPHTEWSSVDTAIAAVGLLAAQSALGLETAGTEAMLRAIDWDDLVRADGMVGHGYAYDGERLASAWDVFGGESWLIDLVYAGATGKVAPLAYSAPPTANGSGFIDELAWLFVPPPSGVDHWGADWAAYRQAAAERQVLYFPTHHAGACVTRLGLFGLSAGEVPAGDGYQAFGVGGRFAEANDGAGLLGAPVVTPHYAALAASLRPREALSMWSWLIASGHFAPLNNVESAIIPAGASCDAASLEWNQLKGSWNLALQTLGWGRYLAERAGQVPALWQATTVSPLLGRGYGLLSQRALAAGVGGSIGDDPPCGHLADRRPPARAPALVVCLCWAWADHEAG